MDKIHIRDILLRCVIGINPEERREKQDVVIDVTLYADLSLAGATDDFNNTVDYKGRQTTHCRVGRRIQLLPG
jgi:D-erythro-7,8-dihydroneopterin triphosphate epimerase